MDIDVRLRNLEYDLTRSIQKVKYGFQSLESVLARLPDKAKFTAFITQNSLPKGFDEVTERIEKVATELAERGGDRFSWELVDPDADGAKVTREQLFENYGFKPMALSLFSDETFYMDLLLEVGDHKERLVPPESLTEADIRKELVAALKRAGPGSLKTIGMATGGSGVSGMSFSRLREALSQTYDVKTVDLGEGLVPGDVDVLLVLDPRDFEEKQRYAIDQFLMRGGSAIVATSSHAMGGQDHYGAQRELNVSKISSGLDDFLKHHGVEVGEEVVLDLQNAAFPIPVTRSLGGFHGPRNPNAQLSRVCGRETQSHGRGESGGCGPPQCRHALAIDRGFHKGREYQSGCGRRVWRENGRGERGARREHGSYQRFSTPQHITGRVAA